MFCNFYIKTAILPKFLINKINSKIGEDITVYLKKKRHLVVKLLCYV